MARTMIIIKNHLLTLTARTNTISVLDPKYKSPAFFTGKGLVDQTDIGSSNMGVTGG